MELDSQSARLDLEPGQKTSGAHFNRFGLITTHHDGNGQRVYFDDLTYNLAAVNLRGDNCPTSWCARTATTAR